MTHRPLPNVLVFWHSAVPSQTISPLPAVISPTFEVIMSERLFTLQRPVHMAPPPEGLPRSTLEETLLLPLSNL